MAAGLSPLVKRRSVLELPLRSGVVSGTTFAALFAEAVAFARSTGPPEEMDDRIREMGVFVGSRAFPLLLLRERAAKRDVEAVQALRTVMGLGWRGLFGHEAERLTKNARGEFIFEDRNPVTCRFVSAPRDAGKRSAAQFVAGIAQGMLSAAGFPATVNAHPDNARPLDDKTLFVVTFETTAE